MTKHNRFSYAKLHRNRESTNVIDFTKRDSVLLILVHLLNTNREMLYCYILSLCWWRMLLQNQAYSVHPSTWKSQTCTRLAATQISSILWHVIQDLKQKRVPLTLMWRVENMATGRESWSALVCWYQCSTTKFRPVVAIVPTYASVAY